MQNTVQDILQFRSDAVSGMYELVRTVGFDVKTPAGYLECRLEAVRRAGESSHAVLVLLRDDYGCWRREREWETGNAARPDAGAALAAALEFVIAKGAEIPAPAPPAPAPEESGEISPEIMSVLAAAVAAFLGKKARIRGARPLRPTTASAWTQQGRVSIQGSHFLARG